jgi:hypothetical protein
MREFLPALRLTDVLSVLSRSSGPDHIQYRQEHDRAKEGNEEAVDVETGDARAAEEVEQESSEQRTDDTNDNVADDALARIVDDFAGQKASDEPHQDPRQNRHATSLSCQTMTDVHAW